MTQGVGPKVSRAVIVESAIVANDVIRLDGPIIITIDGPAGTGKSSVARELARKLGLDFLDTGAMYRAAAAIALRHGIDIRDEATLCRAVEQADLHFDWSLDPPAILVAGEDFTRLIRTPEVTAIVSPAAGIPALRRHMVAKQRLIARQHPRLVTEGRDQGSVVFPEAPLKFYLDAAAAVRARRRFEQLRALGVHADEAELLREIIARDASDAGRSDGPLICPEDAVVVDTSLLSLEGVVGELERLVRQKAAQA